MPHTSTCPIAKFARTGLPVLACVALVPLVALTPPLPWDTAAQSQPAAPTQFRVDDVHSMALFRVQHMGAGQFWGRFNTVEGEANYTLDALSLRVNIDVASVDTGNGQLNAHLKSPDFFNAAEFPAMSFVSKSSKPIGKGRFEVAGELSLHGITKPLTATVDASKVVTMGGKTRAGFETTFEILRSEFGMSYGIEHGAIGDAVRVVVSLETIAQDSTKDGSKDGSKDAAKDAASDTAK